MGGGKGVGKENGQIIQVHFRDTDQVREGSNSLVEESYIL